MLLSYKAEKGAKQTARCEAKQNADQKQSTFSNSCELQNQGDEPPTSDVFTFSLSQCVQSWMLFWKMQQSYWAQYWANWLQLNGFEIQEVIPDVLMVPSGLKPCDSMNEFLNL